MWEYLVPLVNFPAAKSLFGEELQSLQKQSFAVLFVLSQHPYTTDQSECRSVLILGSDCVEKGASGSTQSNWALNS